MDTRQKMKEFMAEAEYLCYDAIAALVGVSSPSLSYFMNNQRTDHPMVESRAAHFLKNDGKSLLDIQRELRDGSANRIELHRMRAEILKKAKVHQTANQRVPSLSNLTI